MGASVSQLRYKGVQYCRSMSRVIKSHPERWWGLGLVLFLVCMVVMWLLLHHDHHQVSAKHQDTTHVNAQVLLDNLRKIRALQSQVAQRPIVQHVAGVQESKALQQRRHAPTQMYSLKSGEGNVSGSTNPVLAGNGAVQDFANQAFHDQSPIYGHVLAHPEYTLVAGEMLSAVLETAINSDLPGMVRAVLSRPAYAYAGHRLLLPAGSRLIGQYRSADNNGAATQRVFVMWQRIVTPEGLSIWINSPGADALGRSGQGADEVDHHFWRIFGQSVLLSILGAGAANYGVGVHDQPNSADAYRQAMAQAVQQTGQTVLSQNRHIRPTLHIHHGDRVTVFVARDVDLNSVLKDQP